MPGDQEVTGKVPASASQLENQPGPVADGRQYLEYPWCAPVRVKAKPELVYTSQVIAIIKRSFARNTGSGMLHKPINSIRYFNRMQSAAVCNPRIVQFFLPLVCFGVAPELICIYYGPDYWLRSPGLSSQFESPQIKGEL